MKPIHSRLTGLAILIAAAGLVGANEATTAAEIPATLVTPDKVESSIGTLEFKDGAPSAATAQKVYDTLDFTRGLDAFLNSYGAHPRMRSVRAFSASAQRTTRLPFTPN